jgi:hypothetical protein
MQKIVRFVFGWYNPCPRSCQCEHRAHVGSKQVRHEQKRVLGIALRGYLQVGCSVFEGFVS